MYCAWDQTRQVEKSNVFLHELLGQISIVSSHLKQLNFCEINTTFRRSLLTGKVQESYKQSYSISLALLAKKILESSALISNLCLDISCRLLSLGR